MIVRNIDEAVDAIVHNTAALLNSDEELYFLVEFDGTRVLLKGSGARNVLRSVQFGEFADEEKLYPFFEFQRHKMGGEVCDICDFDDELSEVVKDLRERLNEQFDEELNGGELMGHA